MRLRQKVITITKAFIKAISIKKTLRTMETVIVAQVAIVVISFATLYTLCRLAFGNKTKE